MEKTGNRILAAALASVLLLSGTLAAGGAKLALSEEQTETEMKPEGALEEETSRVSLALSDDAKASLKEQGEVQGEKQEAKRKEAESETEEDFVQETEKPVSLALSDHAKAASGETAEGQEREKNPDLPDVGEEISGFRVDAVGGISYLDADTIYLTHIVSGARTTVVLNEDENRCFEIGYRTPSLDDSDANHVFEHSILCGSGKYDSTELFYDLSASSYTTYLNATTYPTVTFYPVSSMSEEQLRIIADVYLSCMVDPNVLRDENIFKREAIRYQLNSPEEEITISGTVYAEDLGFMGDLSSNLTDSILKTLYGEDNPASHSNGLLYMDFQSLTYEHLKEVYEKNYRFDNAMIVLYGKLDWRDWLDFLDESYLSDYPAEGTDVMSVLNAPIPEGYQEAVVDSPAYMGAETEKQSSIAYVIDLQYLTEEEQIQLFYMIDMIADSRSPMIKEGEKRALPSEIIGGVEYSFAHPMVFFELDYCDPKDREAFLDVVKTGLEEIADNGVDPDIYESNMVSARLTNGLFLENENAGVDLAKECILGWASLGEVDYLEKKDQILEDLRKDRGQKALKNLSRKLLQCISSCTVTAVPKPGLAEEMEAEVEEILTEMKASMSEKEILKMVEETRAYEDWSEAPRHVSGLSISPDMLPESPDYDSFTFEENEEDGIAVYSAPVPVEDVAATAFCFSLKDFSTEDLYDLELYIKLLGALPTKKYSRDEVKTLLTESVSNLNLAVCWDLESSRPYLYAQYYTLTENYEKSLKLLLELLSETDWEDLEEVLLQYGYLLPSLSEDNNTDRRIYESIWAAASSLEPAYAYRMNLMRPEVSAYYKDLYEGLASGDEEKAKTFSKKMETVTGKLLNRDGLKVVNAASEHHLEAFSALDHEILSKLPKADREEGDISDLLRGNRSTGILTSTDPELYSMWFVKDTDGILTGSDLVYLFAANGEYFTPIMRFQNGVYTPAAVTDVTRNTFYLYTFKDPNLNLSRSAVFNIPSVIREMDLTEEQLNGYILSTYADAISPQGPFSAQMTSVFYAIAHYDTDRIRELLDGIRSSSLNDQDAAWKNLAALLSRAGYGTSGNAETIKAASLDNSLLFDEIIDLRQGDIGEEETEDETEAEA